MIATYNNGNYRVLLNLEDGSKIRWNHEDTLIPDRPESMDVKITNKCYHGCAFCHENSNPSGREADLETMFQFAATVPPYTEIAVGGGNLLENIRHTEYFLKALKEARAVPSITVRQEDYLENMKLLSSWKEQGLIYGIGVSLSDSYDLNLVRCLKYCPTAVLHVIAGVFNEDDYENLKGNDLKLLVLGYKNLRRGRFYLRRHLTEIAANQLMLQGHFDDLKEDFNIVSFDNLALKQLDLQNEMTQEEWKKYFLGDDGDYTFYVDLVKEEFAISSTSTVRQPINGRTVIQMFNEVQRMKEDTTYVTNS